MRVLDLFSGIGGFSLGLERAGMQTAAFCEIDPYCRKVLAKHWPDVPIHEDIRTLDGRDYAGSVELVCGGYPCQPFSHAGKRRGQEDDRHLWPEMRRIIEQARPAWVIGENVAGHISMGLDEVLSDLESLGYTARPFVIPACGVDAPHRRERIWTVGYSNLKPATSCVNTGAAERGEATPPPRAVELGDSDSGGSRSREQDVADADQPGPQGHGRLRQRAGKRLAGEGGWAKQSRWEPEPDVGRVANGVPRRVDRLRCLGNAVVPQVVEMIGRAILTADGDTTVRETADKGTADA